jgi:transcription factor TFIIIB component B''
MVESTDSEEVRNDAEKEFVQDINKVTMAELCSSKYSRLGNNPMSKEENTESKKRSISAIAHNDSENNRKEVAYAGPKVRVVNGQVVIDEQSLLLTSNPLENVSSFEHVKESFSNKKLTSATYMKRDSGGKWSKEETDMFFDGLRKWGTDFEMISKMFPNRTRHQIKNKFTREEKRCSQMIDAALSRK